VKAVIECVKHVGEVKLLIVFHVGFQKTQKIEQEFSMFYMKTQKELDLVHLDQHVL